MRPGVKGTGLGVGPEGPSALVYRPNSPHSTGTFQPQFPHLEWKPHEDRDLALFTVISLEPHRATGHTYLLNEYINL